MKHEYQAFRSRRGPRPDRRAFAIVIEKGAGQVSEVIVNLSEAKVEDWKDVSDVGPTLTLEDLDVTERVARDDPRVIKACKEIGITDMSKVFFDAWAIGVDSRWGRDIRLQQGLAVSANVSSHPVKYLHCILVLP